MNALDITILIAAYVCIIATVVLASLNNRKS